MDKLIKWDPEMTKCVDREINEMPRQPEKVGWQENVIESFVIPLQLKFKIQHLHIACTSLFRGMVYTITAKTM